MVDQVRAVAQPSRLWRIVLVGSLAVNLAIAGLIVGSAFSGRLGGGPPRTFDLGVGPVVRALDRDERRHIGLALRRDRGLRDLDMRANASEMLALLRSDPFDPEALGAVFAGQNAQLALLQQRAQGLLLARITAMSAERRAVFADRLQEELSRARAPGAGRSGG